MVAVLAFLFVVALSLLILRVGTIALILTGLSEDIASFQALSAYTGTGFTTSETEKVVHNPARRRVMRDLMILGNMGVVSTIATAILSIGYLRDPSVGLRPVAVLLGGFAVLIFLSFSKFVRNAISVPIRASLSFLTRLELQDYADLLQLEGGFRVAELQVDGDDWVKGRTLIDMRLADEGVWVLGIRRKDGRYLGVPLPTTEIREGDVLVAYGKEASLADLAGRPAGEVGDRAHVTAKEREARFEAVEDFEDKVAVEKAPEENPERSEDGAG